MIKVQVHGQSSAPTTSSPNDWIRPLRDEWGREPLKFLPRAADGLKILDRLIALPEEIQRYDNFVPFESVYDGQEPTMAHVMADLESIPMEHLSIIDQGLKSVAFGLSKAQLLAAWFRAPYIREFKATNRLYSILDLPFQKEGSRLCGIKVPASVLELGIEEKVEGVKSRGSSVCPAGTLTDIHKDFSGSGQLMVSIEARKLWLIWPPTAKNLEWWTAYHTRVASSTLTLDAIEAMEGLRILYHKGKMSFLLLPYHFHAVLTFEASAHCGMAIWRLDWWKDIARAGAEWEFLWARDHAANGFTGQEADGVLKEMQMAEEHWGKLANKFPGNDIAKALRVWNKDMGKKVKDVRKQIERVSG